jgi:hypothetical protein
MLGMKRNLHPRPNPRFLGIIPCLHPRKPYALWPQRPHHPPGGSGCGLWSVELGLAGDHFLAKLGFQGPVCLQCGHRLEGHTGPVMPRPHGTSTHQVTCLIARSWWHSENTQATVTSSKSLGLSGGHPPIHPAFPKIVWIQRTWDTSLDLSLSSVLLLSQ